MSPPHSNTITVTREYQDALVSERDDLQRETGELKARIAYIERERNALVAQTWREAADEFRRWINNTSGDQRTLEAVANACEVRARIAEGRIYD